MVSELGTVLVTGGSSGLGAAVVHAVMDAGGTPVILDGRPGGCHPPRAGRHGDAVLRRPAGAVQARARRPAQPARARGRRCRVRPPAAEGVRGARTADLPVGRDIVAVNDRPILLALRAL